MRIAIAAPAQSTRALALLCATPTTDLRTSDVRIDVRTGDVAQTVKTVEGKRVRVFAPTAGMGHVDFAAGYAWGSQTWSPPI
ncbi:hypothetical protein F0U44_01380 [Nocardioides humilatus]|uniref:Uncharacterized protein n=1 Tax=Nocardioides humilatus TaxID=2607660 RepID=A0A5B1LKC3_9ACTN|nr:hypothetical protein [Nocardioides humilatus]KAA1421013.1 hypothetical protein F0U44_01380 [Nocardioides humilatus]